MTELMLKNLVERWNGFADAIEKVDGKTNEVHQLRKCATELEAVIGGTAWARLTLGKAQSTYGQDRKEETWGYDG